MNNKFTNILIALVIGAAFLGSGMFIGGMFKKPTIEPELTLAGFKAAFPEAFTVATSGEMTIFNDAQILATSTTKRLYALICNDSSNVVYLSMNQDKAATANAGIRLNANGGCYEINTENLYDGAIRATSSASSGLTVTEANF